MTLRRRLLIEWLIIIIFGTLAAVLMLQWKGTAAFDNMFYDQLGAASRADADRDILIINIDEQSLAQLGKWPWSRTTHARLIEKLSAQQPGSILLDLLVSESGDATDDRALAMAMRKAGTVYLPANFSTPGSNGKAYNVELPTPFLADAAADVGHVNILYDTDGIVRQVNICFQPEAGGPNWPHLAELAYRDGGTPSPAYRSLKNCNHPLLLPYAPRGSFAEISYSDALNGTIPTGLVRNKDILIGVSAAGMGDSYAAPFGDGGAISGVEIIANMVSALRTNSSIRPIEGSAMMLLSLLPMWTLMLGFLRWRPRTALIASIAAVLLVLSVSAAGLAARLWFAPGAALAGILLVYPLWGWRRLQAMSAFMEHELGELQREGDILPVPRKRERASDLVGRQSATLASAIDHLRSLRRFVSDSLEHLPDPMFVTSTDGRVTIASHKIEDYLSAKLEDTPLGELLDRLVIPSHRTLVDEFLANRNAGDDRPSYVRFAAPDGKQFVMRQAEILGDDCVLLGHIHYLTDISELAKAESDREQALQLLSHDMRAPQSAIIAMLPALPDAQTRSRIERHARRTIKLAQDFVDIARMGETHFDGVDILFGDLVKDVADSLWPLAQERQVRIRVEDDTDGGFIVGEPDGLSRAVSNLFDNAIKFSPEGGMVIAKITRDQSPAKTLRLCISDEGGGIDVDLLPRLFSRFASKAKEGGRIKSTGLGLTFVSAVAQRHKGRVHAENGEKGACFCLTLPEAEDISPDPGA
jgi:CHASE2 domain-containing sensor protein/signal transduction histidine kinase